MANLETYDNLLKLLHAVAVTTGTIPDKLRDAEEGAAQLSQLSADKKSIRLDPKDFKLLNEIAKELLPRIGAHRTSRPELASRTTRITAAPAHAVSPELRSGVPPIRQVELPARSQISFEEERFQHEQSQAAAAAPAPAPAAPSVSVLQPHVAPSEKVLVPGTESLPKEGVALFYDGVSEALSETYHIIVDTLQSDYPNIPLFNWPRYSQHYTHGIYFVRAPRLNSAEYAAARKQTKHLMLVVVLFNEKDRTDLGWQLQTLKGIENVDGPDEMIDILTDNKDHLLTAPEKVVKSFKDEWRRHEKRPVSTIAQPQAQQRVSSPARAAAAPPGPPTPTQTRAFAATPGIPHPAAPASAAATPAKPSQPTSLDIYANLNEIGYIHDGREREKLQSEIENTVFNAFKRKNANATFAPITAESKKHIITIYFTRSPDITDEAYMLALNNSLILIAVYTYTSEFAKVELEDKFSVLSYGFKGWTYGLGGRTPEVKLPLHVTGFPGEIEENPVRISAEMYSQLQEFMQTDKGKAVQEEINKAESQAQNISSPAQATPPTPAQTRAFTSTLGILPTAPAPSTVQAQAAARPAVQSERFQHEQPRAAAAFERILRAHNLAVIDHAIGRQAALVPVEYLHRRDLTEALLKPYLLSGYSPLEEQIEEALRQRGIIQAAARPAVQSERTAQRSGLSSEELNRYLQNSNLVVREGIGRLDMLVPRDFPPQAAEERIRPYLLSGTGTREQQIEEALRQRGIIQ